MSAQAGTSSPKPDLLPVRSLRLFEMLTKGHIRHVRVNKRSVSPAHIVPVTLSVGRPHAALFKWAYLQSVKSTAAIWNSSWSDRRTVKRSAFLPRVISGKLCERQDFSQSPVDSETTHRDTHESISPILLLDKLRVDHTYLNTLSLWLHYHMYCVEVPAQLGGPRWVHFSERKTFYISRYLALLTVVFRVKLSSTNPCQHFCTET